MLFILTKSSATFKTRIEERLGKDKNSKIIKHSQESSKWRQISNFDYFDLIDCQNSVFRLGCNSRTSCI